MKIKDRRKCIVNLGDCESVTQGEITQTTAISVVRRGADCVITNSMSYEAYELRINDSNGDVYDSGAFDAEGKATVRFLFDQNYISCA